MRIGLVSDIHCDADALGLALNEMDGDVDEVWCAGDIVSQHRFCLRTIGLLREAGAVAIRGNHDRAVLTDAAAAARGGRPLDDPDVAWLASLPVRREAVTPDGRRLLMVHASPWAPHDDYLRPHNPRWRRAGELGVDVLLTGHTHEPMAERFAGTLVVNPGSLGEPRQRPDRVPTYAVVDLAAGTAAIRSLRNRDEE